MKPYGFLSAEQAAGLLIESGIDPAMQGHRNSVLCFYCPVVLAVPDGSYKRIQDREVYPVCDVCMKKYEEEQAMSRVTTREDLYEFRVKQIFKQLRADYEDRIGASEVPFSEWIEKNREQVGIAFLSDVESYCGLPVDSEQL